MLKVVQCMIKEYILFSPHKIGENITTEEDCLCHSTFTVHCTSALKRKR